MIAKANFWWTFELHQKLFAVHFILYTFSNHIIQRKFPTYMKLTNLIDVLPETITIMTSPVLEHVSIQ